MDDPNSLCFLRLPLFHAEMTPVPLPFTLRVRYNTFFTTSIPPFEVLAFLFPLSAVSAGLPDLEPDFVPSWTMVEPVIFRALLLCDKLGICFHLTNQCRRVFNAPNLLPEPASLRLNDACQSKPLLFSFAAEPGLAQAKYLPPILHTLASLPTSSSKLISLRLVSSFSLFVDIRHPVTYDQPTEHCRDNGASKLRDGSFDPFL